MSNFIKSKKSPSTSNKERVGSCFTDKDVTHLAQIMRQYYSSFLWREGDVLLVDNKKVMHAGMPGMGERVIRAMICSPLDIDCSPLASGFSPGRERSEETIGACMMEQKILKE